MRHELKVLRALRELSRSAGSSAVEGLAPLVYKAADSSWQTGVAPWFEDELVGELCRVLGAELGEETPLTLEDLAMHLASRSDGQGRRRVGVMPLTIELSEASGRLKQVARSPALSSEVLDAIESARNTLMRACVRSGIVASDNLYPLAHGLGAWDPLAAMAELRQHLTSCTQRLMTRLNQLHHPLVLEPDEVVLVARWVLGGPAPAQRRALLALASALDPLCRCAPLAAPDLERLRLLARQADLERQQEGWQVLADRLWLLRKRLVGPNEKAVPPLYRKHPSQSERRPDSLEGMLRSQ